MGLFDEVTKEQASMHPGPLCKVSRITEQMDKKDAADLLKLIGEGYMASAISRVLRKRGIDVSATSISRHRNGDCACSRRGL